MNVRELIEALEKVSDQEVRVVAEGCCRSCSNPVTQVIVSTGSFTQHFDPNYVELSIS